MTYLRCMIAALVMLVSSCQSDDWHEARRDSAGIAPDPAATEEAVLQVYGARAWGWRGYFAIHTWIAAKKRGERIYTVYDVVGWRAGWGDSVVRVQKDIPDRYWYGARPRLIAQYRGAGVDSLIDRIDRAAMAYPWKNTYRGFPGPNSNTFIAWIGSEVPQLQLDLPLNAIGSGYLHWHKTLDFVKNLVPVRQ